MQVNGWSFARRAIGRLLAGAMVVATLVNTASPAWATPASAAGSTGRGKVAKLFFSAEGMSVSIAATTRTLHVSRAVTVAGTMTPSGRILSTQETAGRPLGPSAKASGSFACIEKLAQNPYFSAYPPTHSYQDGRSHTYDFLEALYSVQWARELQPAGRPPYWTFQLQYCTTGGGNTSNGYHQDFVGNAITWEGNSDAKIGWTWGNGSSNPVSTQLAFDVGAGIGPVDIGAKVSVVLGQGTIAGDLGNDGRFPGIMVPAGWNDTRTNAFFTSPSNFIWDGMADYEGNTDQTLYEWPMKPSNDYTFYSYAAQEGFCAEVFGCSQPW